MLASGSPRRLAFMRELGLAFSSVVPNGEPSPFPDEMPESYALRAAEAKARAVLSSVPRLGAVVAADTIVTADEAILGKPADAAHALAMLERLVGRDHKVITACCVIARDGAGTVERLFAVHSAVTFATPPREALEAYAACGEPLDKAGAYAVQGRGAFLIKRLEGSWTNVVGLPLAELVDTLLELRLIAPTRAK